MPHTVGTAAFAALAWPIRTVDKDPQLRVPVDLHEQTGITARFIQYGNAHHPFHTRPAALAPQTVGLTRFRP